MANARIMSEDPARLSPALGDRERRYVYAVAMRYVKDPTAAEDVTQDALLLAHRHRASFRGSSRYSTWLYRVAATAALMYLRKRRRIERGEAPEPDEAAARPLDRVDPAPGPAERCAARELLSAVERRLEALGPRYREIVALRFVADLTDREAAEVLGVGLSTVKTRTHRARIALREAAAA